MATRLTSSSQHLFRYQCFQINKCQPLGNGAYGAVYKAKCDQLPCAAKVLHSTIQDPKDQGVGRVMSQFRQECSLLERIRHPNIVQYLAMTVDQESGLPVLLMELLDESLTKMLERSQQPLAYYIQVDICHDVALAIAYLHSNHIIHRDLSSNNVLITAGRRAKVTDFGMSKLAGAVSTVTPLELTMCPGTLAYMPPEALREPPKYTEKLDCFSEGVLMIQVCTRLWPEPGPRARLVTDSRSLSGKMEIPIPELERRKNHLDLIDPTNPLLPIATDCLQYHERERPSSEELCQRLASLKEFTEYKECVQQEKDEIRAKNDQFSNGAMAQQLHEIAIEKEQTIRATDRVLKQRESKFQDALESRERQLRQLNQQLKEQEQVMAVIQQTNHSLQRQVEQLQRQLSQQVHRTHNHKLDQPKERKVTLNWREGDQAKFEMSRGAAVVDGCVTYFLNVYGQMCSYNLSNKKWSQLPKYPYKYGSLAIVSGHLTAIGGCEDVFRNNTYTNKLLCLIEKWSVIFPPMPTKRRNTTAVTSRDHLIVAGGTTGVVCVDSITTVEVMDTNALVWSTVASLPRPYNWVSATLSGDHLYVLGGDDDKDKTKEVMACSVTNLLQSTPPSLSVWGRVADAPPCCHSTVQLSMGNYTYWPWQLVDMTKNSEQESPFGDRLHSVSF